MLPFLRKGLLPKDQKEFASKLQKITGLVPRNFPVYVLALTHSSFLNKEDIESESNERLEFLGDAILDAVVAEFLFKKFPYKNEGFLTEMRSRIVKRETLNMIGKSIGLEELVKVGIGSKTNKSILGNALEALIGAVYLDYGYLKTYKFLEIKLIKPFIDLDELISTTDNYKSLLLEWGDKHNKEIVFEIAEEIKHKSYTEFKAVVLINGKKKSSGVAKSKKKAEQAAAEVACERLKISVA